MSTVIGLAVVLVLVGFAANVSIGLWTRSTVDSVSYDVARRVSRSLAGGPSPEVLSAIQSDAISDGRSLLGNYGRTVQMDFVASDPDLVALRVRAPGVSLLPRAIADSVTIGAIDRTIVIRRETP